MQVYGRFWIKKNEKNYLGIGRVGLLKGIDYNGSIAQAAKDMKMSYKAAWDAIDTINNLSNEPLIQRKIGGKRGGGSHLTDEGKLAIEAYEALEAAKMAFCNYLNNAKDLNELKTRAKTLMKKIQD